MARDKLTAVPSHSGKVQNVHLVVTCQECRMNKVQIESGAFFPREILVTAIADHQCQCPLQILNNF